ncbi:uncharacterized protein LOC114255955 [Camellia sinensis]|uniref:uncharacterized protein LOC114255955 n=1 Tax=Camellia sinensis TaxID=4442 RepID=UPI00103656C7|nr:uncharacterized protein LOC114255955 [Camellia sinensis]
MPQDDALIIELRVNKFAIKRILVDQGSTSKIMYYKTFLKLSLKDADLMPTDYPLFTFNAKPEYPMGKIVLLVHVGTKTLEVEFLVVKLSSPYNMVMGQTWLHAMKVLPSTYHKLFRYLTQCGIEQIYGSQRSTNDYYLTALVKKSKDLEVNSITVSD